MSDASLSHYTISENDYLYFGEGNSNIILSVKNSGLVLRLRKSSINKSIDNSSTSASDEWLMLNQELEFHEKILKSLIRNDFIHTSVIVKLQKDNIDSLNQKLLKIRPPSRKHKEVLCNYGILTLDYTSNTLFPKIKIPTLCVELKCKQGWMPDAFKPYKRCMYCLNQYLKLKEKKISSISNYCPLDLFSGNSYRMKKALKNLIENPQNNFRVFISEKHVSQNTEDLASHLDKYFSTTDSLDILINLLVKILLNNCGYEPRSTLPGPSCNTNKLPSAKQSCDPSSIGLPCKSVLKEILRLQMLEKDVVLGHSELPSENYIEDLLDLHFQLTQRGVADFDILHKSLLPLHKYMIACSAKDCSIMISMKPVRYPDLDDQDLVFHERQAFVTKIGLIDLDPKPVHKIAYHKERDENVIKSYKSFKV